MYFKINVLYLLNSLKLLIIEQDNIETRQKTLYNIRCVVFSIVLVLYKKKHSKIRNSSHKSQIIFCWFQTPSCQLVIYMKYWKITFYKLVIFCNIFVIVCFVFSAFNILSYSVVAVYLCLLVPMLYVFSGCLYLLEVGSPSSFMLLRNPTLMYYKYNLWRHWFIFFMSNRQLIYLKTKPTFTLTHMYGFGVLHKIWNT